MSRPRTLHYSESAGTERIGWSRTDPRRPANEISNCSQDASSTPGKGLAFISSLSRRRKTEWPSREMQRHVEKVQSVGNLLDSRDNFIVSRNLVVSYWKMSHNFTNLCLCVHIYRNNYCANKITTNDHLLVFITIISNMSKYPYLSLIV